MPLCNRKEYKADLQVYYFASINLFLAPLLQPGVRATMCQDWQGFQKSKVNVNVGLEGEQIYLHVSSAAGLTLCFLCLWLCCALQHGTEWASSGCVRCSCAHGKVNCTPPACPALACERGELQYIHQGSCCPRCVGRGGEYCLASLIQVGHWKSLFSPKSGKLFLSCSVLLGGRWCQMCPLILFRSC